MKENYLTFEELTYLINKYKIPHNVRLQSDSGWECNATDMCGIYYNKKENIIVFTQKFDVIDIYTKKDGWIKLIGE
jgi:hypothetical protein